MSDYDSDSSLGDAPYTETNVLLGYATADPTDDPISHLGGTPTWLDPASPPSAALARCRSCNAHTALLLELNGDLPDRFPGHERRLYVFACRRKACRRKEGCVRGIRGVRVGEVARDEAAKAAPDAIAVGGGEPNPPPPPAEEEKEKPNLGATLFGVAPSAPSASARANPFSTTTPNPSAGGGPNPFSPPPAASLAAKPAQTPRQQPATAQQPSLAETFAAKARISPTDPPSPSIVPPALPPRAHESWPSPADQPTPYAHFHLDADYETLSAPPSAPPTTTATLDDSAEGGGGGGVNDREDKLLFESAMDRAFQTFADRLAHNPEQVLRYEFGGAPLLCSAADAIGRRLLPDKRLAMPPCESCGAARVFEAQLTPHAIAELEDGDEGVEGMEWGTVILGVCGRDCVPRGVGAGEAGYLEEWVGVQWEEVVKNT